MPALAARSPPVDLELDQRVEVEVVALALAANRFEADAEPGEDAQQAVVARRAAARAGASGAGSTSATVHHCGL